MLKIKNLKKAYAVGSNKEYVLKGIDFEIQKGSFNVIIGPSGCGKSTLLNIITGLDSNYEGSVSYYNEELKEINLDIFRKRAIGFVFQNFNLIPHLNVLENVKSSLYLNTMSEKERNDIARSVLKKVGLEGFEHKLPNILSGGQRQRVAVARALANNPSIIVADEPTGALDSVTSVEILELLKDLAKGGTTVVVVTHDDVVLEYATKIISLMDGLVLKETIIDDINLKSEKPFFDKTKLSFKNAMKLSFNNFKQRKVRNTLVALGTSIGITGIILALSLSGGIKQEIASIFDGIFSPNQILAALKLDGTGGGFGPPDFVGMSSAEQKDLISLMEKEKITKYEYQSYNKGVAYEYNGVEYPLNPGTQQVSMLDSSETKMDSYNVKDETLVSGARLFKEKEGILITQTLANQLLGFEKNQENSKYDVLINQPLTIYKDLRSNSEVTRVKHETVILGVSPSSEGVNFSTSIWVSNKTMENLFKLENKEIEIDALAFYADSPKEAQKVAEKFKDNKTYSITTSSTIIKTIQSFLDIISITLAFVAGLSLLVASIMISIVLYISVMERTREIGVLRAIGYKKINISSLFLIESVLIGFLSNIIAISVSVALMLIANPIVEKSFGIKNAIIITPSSILFVVSLTIIIGVLAAIYPARNASKKDPAISLRYE